MLDVKTGGREEQICRRKWLMIRHMVNLSVQIRYVTDFVQDVVVASAHDEYIHIPERERGHTVYTTAESSVLWYILYPLAKILCWPRRSHLYSDLNKSLPS